MAYIKFLVSTMGDDPDDVVKVLHETETEVYYEDGLERYVYLSKDEEGVVFIYTSDRS